MAASGRAWEIRTAALFGAVGLVGFCTDFLVLKLCLHWMEPAFARLISLFCAMNVTFTINGLFVFRCLALRKLPRQWGAYLVTNGFGNFCNYWIFVTLISLHSRVWSNHLLALMLGSGAAYVINYVGTRFFAFRHQKPSVAAVQTQVASVGPLPSERAA